jgi:hypothetical protein
MIREKLGLIAALGALTVVLACSKSQAASGARKDSTTTAAADATTSDDDSGPQDPPIDCSKIFTPADAAGILTKPATVEAYAPFPRSCILETSTGGEFRVHTGTDVTTEMGWDEMSNSGNSAKYTALPNVGDQAFYRIQGSAELFSKKGKMYCSIITSEVSNTGDFTSDRGAALAAKLGALCTKMFAAT